MKNDSNELWNKNKNWIFQCTIGGILVLAFINGLVWSEKLARSYPSSLQQECPK